MRKFTFFRYMYFVVILTTSCETIQTLTKSAKLNNKNASTENETRGKFKPRPAIEPYDPIDRIPNGYKKLNYATFYEGTQNIAVNDEKKILSFIPYNIQKNKKEISVRLSYPTDLKGNYILLSEKNPISRISMINNQDTCIIVKYTLRRIQNNKPYQISIVLDHSGSMGDERCMELQNAISDVFKSEKLNHITTIYKFDSEVMLQGTAKNSQELEQIIKHKSGMEGFGGSTSIFDALDLSINSFQADSSYQPVIILFSDGYENSSKKSDIKSIVGNAKMRNIPIFTIAFGEGADGNLLSSIANETNGTFWQTYDRNEFKYIFSNELFLLNQYYEIKFLPCSFDYEKILITGNTKLGNQAYGEKTLLGLKEVISLSINFDFNSSTIDSKYKDDLDKIAVYLARNSNYNINIYGHTDNTGTKEYNQILSLDRAQAIRQALINRGINKTRITAIGKGEDEPYVPNTTEENKYRNRRIEVELIK